MQSKLKPLFLSLVALSAILSAPGISARADNPNAPADVTIGTQVVAPNPEHFGAFVGVSLNQFIPDPSMEPIVLRWQFQASGGGANYVTAGNLDYFQTLGDHFFDGAAIRVYHNSGGVITLVRSDTVTAYLQSDRSHSSTDGTITLQNSDAAHVAQNGDYIYLDLVKTDQPGNLAYARTPDNLYARTGKTWQTSSPTITSYDTTTQAPVDGGKSSLRIARTTTGTARVTSGGVFDWTGNGYYPTLKAGHTYRLEAWMKQTGIASGAVQLDMSSFYYNASRHTHTVGNGWQKYSFDFVAPNWNTGGSPVSIAEITYNGPGTLWIDNFVLYDTASPVYAPDPDQQAAFKAFQPGSMRTFSGWVSGTSGLTMDNWLNTPAINERNWEVNNGPQTLDSFHVPTALQFAKDTGAQPWLVVCSCMNEQEWRDFMAYLAGPTGTTYGDRRAAQGHANPWTDDFSKIRIEIDNETWNNFFGPFTFGFNGTNYGQYAEYIIQQMKASPYYAAVAGKIDFVVNGWAIQTDQNGYGASAKKGSPSANYVDVTSYVGGWETNTSVGGSTISDAGYQEYLLFTPAALIPQTDGHTATRDLLNAQGYQYGLATYESGPSYNLPGPGILDTVNQEYGKSLAAGVTTLDSLLYNSLKGFGPQNYFTFGIGLYWTSHTPPGFGYIPYPSWQALQMRNQYATGDMVRVVENSTPTIDLSSKGSFPNAANTPLIATYAFQDNGKYSVFVLNRSLTTTTPVTLHLPAMASPNATLVALTGNPRYHNLNGQLGLTNPGGVLINTTSAPVSDFSQNYTFNMPPGSIYLFLAATSGPTIPIPPANLTATAANGKITLAWTAVPGATAYNVYRSTVSGNEGLIPYQAGVTATALIDTSVQSEQPYYYEVSAINAAGEGIRSNEATATLHDPPTNLVATATDGKIILTWNPPVNVPPAYNLYRGVGDGYGGGGGETLYQSNITTNAYADIVPNGTKYYYYVVAAYPGHEGSASNESNALAGYMLNPGFEVADGNGSHLANWLGGGAGLFANQDTPHSGAWNGFVNQAYNSLFQNAQGLKPNTTYTLTAWAKQAGPMLATKNQPALYVNSYGGGQRSAAITSLTYQQLSVTFTTDASHTSAQVGVYMTGMNLPFYVDDFAISTTINAALTGTVALDGVTDFSAVNPLVPVGTLTFDFFAANSATHTAPLFTQTAALTPVGSGSPHGTFSLPNVPAGNYDIAVSGSKQLRKVVANVSAVGGTQAIPGVTTLLGGNANGDSTVNFDDFLVLLNAFGSTVADSSSGFDPTADFNYDGIVNFDDFLILLNNFGAVGDN